MMMMIIIIIIVMVAIMIIKILAIMMAMIKMKKFIFIIVIMIRMIIIITRKWDFNVASRIFFLEKICNFNIKLFFLNTFGLYVFHTQTPIFFPCIGHIPLPFLDILLSNVVLKKFIYYFKQYYSY